MGTAVNGPANRQIESLLLDGMIGAWSDDQLLARFAEESGSRAERAFEALVERHGPRVFRVCRAVTGDHPTAEDAFQATFLVLARKAGSLRVSDSLGPWLHGVAARVAASARMQRAKRIHHETSAAHRGEPLTTDTESDADLARILHLEVGRLRAPFRDAVYLCDIEGLDHQSAALRMGCAMGTLRTRLFRGRRQLRGRLIRRGILPAAILALSAKSARAGLSPRLVESVSKSAVAILSGSASEAIPSSVVILFQETMIAMLKTKIRIAVGAAVVALSAVTAAVFAQDGPNVPVNRIADAKPAPEAFQEPASADARPEVPLAARFGEPKQNANAVNPFQNIPKVGEPSDKEILMELVGQKFRNVTIDIETVAEKAEPVRQFPKIGAGKLVHIQYKATIHYQLADGDKLTPKVDVVFFDRDTIKKVDATLDRVPDPNTGVAFQEYARFADARPNQMADAHPGTDTEKRLAEVEHKLDRILKALELGDKRPTLDRDPNSMNKGPAGDIDPRGRVAK